MPSHIFWRRFLLKSQFASEAPGSMMHTSGICQALSLFLGLLLSSLCFWLFLLSLLWFHTKPRAPLTLSCSSPVSLSSPAFPHSEILFATFWQSTALFPCPPHFCLDLSIGKVLASSISFTWQSATAVAWILPCPGLRSKNVRIFLAILLQVSPSYRFLSFK